MTPWHLLVVMLLGSRSLNSSDKTKASGSSQVLAEVVGNSSLQTISTIHVLWSPTDSS